MPPQDVCNRARLARDARFDGLFFIAVKSTGIYCRCVCPAPTAKRANIEFLPTAASAVAMGYRPCLRCRPELSPEAFARLGGEPVRRALAAIAQGALQDGSVEALAAGVGMSDRQLRRLFLAQVGATPIAVHATRRLLMAKQLITETAMPMTDIAMAAGFNSLRRFNAAFREGCGMPPTAIRRQSTPVDGGGLRLRLGYRPPLDFPAMLAFLAKRAIPGIERIGPDAYERVLGPPDATSRIRVEAVPGKSELLLEIRSPDPRAIPGILQCARRVFDLDAVPDAVADVLGQDPLLAAALDKRPGLRIPGGWDGFEVAVRAVLGQQVSVAGATTLARRLVERFGEPRHAVDPDDVGTFDRCFPSPERLVDATLESIGLPRSRAASLRALSRAVLDGRVSFDAGQALDAFVERLTALPGIGPWTAHYLALRGLGHPDAFPAGDLVLQQVLGGERRLSERACEARSQAWRPWRGYAVLQLWHLANDAARDRARAA